jgi:PAS domain S-box-containing protein
MKVLFLCGGNACRSQMAEALFRSHLIPDVEVFSAGLRADGVHPLAIESMAEIGLDISANTSKTVSQLGQTAFDLVINLCEEAHKYTADSTLSCNTKPDDPRNCALFIGMPLRLYWPLPDPAKASDKTLFRTVRKSLANNIEQLISLGFLESIGRQRRQMEHIFDAMEDGLVAHDQNRNIFLFNRAAERITGFSKQEVLGQDCHAIFSPGGLCGSRCPFKSCQANEKEREYEVVVTNKAGEDRRLRITSSPLDLLQGERRGVVATIRDITEVIRLRNRYTQRHSFHGMVSSAKSMQDIFQTIRQIATSDYPVLITGESGTGKELVARAIHNESRRAKGPFVPINCGALPANILESELFGHVRGAFTGAIRDKKGRFQLADKGTLLLDELGELEPLFQVKLLRVLQEKSFEQVGGEKSIQVDVRVVAATNQDLKQMIQAGSFREDLFYRLCVVPLHLPPLRERIVDIPLLCDQILKRIQQEIGKSNISLSNTTMDTLTSYSWPGNIRELINILQFSAVRCDEDIIQPIHLPPELRHHSRARPDQTSLNSHPESNGKLTAGKVQRALDSTEGNKVKAAKLLGVGRATLYRFLSKNSE